jgi:hypothetical protein
VTSLENITTSKVACQMSVPSSADQAPCSTFEKQPAGPVASNTFKNISAADDSCQLIVSTTGVVIEAADITTGQRVAHGMGQMNDTSVQMLLQRDIRTLSNTTKGQKATQSSWERYGTGHNIKDGISQAVGQ